MIVCMVQRSDVAAGHDETRLYNHLRQTCWLRILDRLLTTDQRYPRYNLNYFSFR